jgi:hypothetical protein
MADICHHLVDYIATHPNAGMHYLGSNMILAVHTNTSYLSEHNTRSWASAYFYLTNRGDNEFNNGTILNLANIIKHVMSSGSEAELAALYYGCKLATPIRSTLDDMGHTQHPAPVTTEKITAQGLTVGIMTPKASISIDQQFHWLKCQSAQSLFLYLWRHDILN